ncbi:hypothetical protein WMY93_007958 [Mugilogobius chulae]|uniref:Uncharacterized protein n=1 Tax=Mugilogobius chulae TaxID=88201 RepID=A0AAW0PND2_9GOBI
MCVESDGCEIEGCSSSDEVRTLSGSMSPALKSSPDLHPCKPGHKVHAALLRCRSPAAAAGILTFGNILNYMDRYTVAAIEGTNEKKPPPPPLNEREVWGDGSRSSSTAVQYSSEIHELKRKSPGSPCLVRHRCTHNLSSDRRGVILFIQLLTYTHCAPLLAPALLYFPDICSVFPIVLGEGKCMKKPPAQSRATWHWEESVGQEPASHSRTYLCIDDGCGTDKCSVCPRGTFSHLVEESPSQRVSVCVAQDIQKHFDQKDSGVGLLQTAGQVSTWPLISGTTPPPLPPPLHLSLPSHGSEECPGLEL